MSGVVDLTFDGVVRHEYGHYLDHVFQFAGSAGGDASLAARRANVLSTWTPAMARDLLSANASQNDRELFAELFTLISHPDYPNWKQKMVDDGMPLQHSPDPNGLSLFSVEALDAAESYFNINGVPFYPVALRDDQAAGIDLIFVPQGVKLNKDGLPPEPGKIPVPPGMIRLYHFTDSDQSLESILEDGIDVSHARGETYGEPNMIWASAEKPAGHKPYVEFFARPEELDPLIGRPTGATPGELQASIDAMMERGSNVTLLGDNLPPTRFVSFNNGEVSARREMLSYSNDAEFRAAVLNGDYDYLTRESSGWAKALAYVKTKWADAPAPTELIPADKTIRRSSIPNIDTDRLKRRLEWLSNMDNVVGRGRIPYSLKMAEKVAIENELLRRGEITKAELVKRNADYNFKYANDMLSLLRAEPRTSVTYFDSDEPFTQSEFDMAAQGMEGAADEWRHTLPRLPDDLVRWAATVEMPADLDMRGPERNVPSGLGTGDVRVVNWLAQEMSDRIDMGLNPTDDQYHELYFLLTGTSGARRMLEDALTNGASPEQLALYRIVHEHFLHQADRLGYGDDIPLERLSNGDNPFAYGGQYGELLVERRESAAPGLDQTGVVSFIRHNTWPLRVGDREITEPADVDALEYLTPDVGRGDLIDPDAGGPQGWRWVGKLNRSDILGAFGDTSGELVAGRPESIQRFLATGEPTVAPYWQTVKFTEWSTPDLSRPVGARGRPKTFRQKSDLELIKTAYAVYAGETERVPVDLTAVLADPTDDRESLVAKLDAVNDVIGIVSPVQRAGVPDDLVRRANGNPSLRRLQKVQQQRLPELRAKLEHVAGSLQAQIDRLDGTERPTFRIDFLRTSPSARSANRAAGLAVADVNLDTDEVVGDLGDGVDLTDFIVEDPATNPFLTLGDGSTVWGLGADQSEVGRRTVEAYQRGLDTDDQFRRRVAYAGVVSDFIKDDGGPLEEQYQAAVAATRTGLADGTIVAESAERVPYGMSVRLRQYEMRNVFAATLLSPNPDPEIVALMQQMHILTSDVLDDRPMLVRRSGVGRPFAGNPRDLNTIATGLSPEQRSLVNARPQEGVTSWTNAEFASSVWGGRQWLASAPPENVLFHTGEIEGEYLVAEHSEIIERLVEGVDAAPFTRPPENASTRAINPVLVSNPNRLVGDRVLDDWRNPPDLTGVTYDGVPAARVQVIPAGSDLALMDAAAVLDGRKGSFMVTVDRPRLEMSRADFDAAMTRSDTTVEDSNAANLVKHTQNELAGVFGADGRVVLYRATGNVDDPFGTSDSGVTSWTAEPWVVNGFARRIIERDPTNDKAGIVAASIPIQQILSWDDVGWLGGEGEGREVLVAPTPDVARRVIEASRPYVGDGTQIDLLQAAPAGWDNALVSDVTAALADSTPFADSNDVRLTALDDWVGSDDGPALSRQLLDIVGGKQPYGLGAPITSGDYPWEPESFVVGAYLYEDLRTTKTTADHSLWRGLSSPQQIDEAKTLSVGDTFDDIRGFSSSREVADAFATDQWVYQIEPGDARLVDTQPALAAQGFDTSWAGVGRAEANLNEREVIVGGTFEVTDVDRRRRVVTIRQTAPLPESDLATRLKESAGTIKDTGLDQPKVLKAPKSRRAIDLVALPPFESVDARLAESERRRNLARATQAQRENTSIYPIDVLPVVPASDANPAAPGEGNGAVRAYRGPEGNLASRRIPRQGETIDIYRDLGRGRAHKRGYEDGDAFSVRMASSSSGNQTTQVQASTIGVELANPRPAWAAGAKLGFEQNDKRGVHGFLRGEVARWLTADEAATVVSGDGWEEVTYYPGTQDFFLPGSRERVVGGDRAILSMGKFYMLNPQTVKGAPKAPRSQLEDKAESTGRTIDFLLTQQAVGIAQERGAAFTRVEPLLPRTDPALPNEDIAAVAPRIPRDAIPANLLGGTSRSLFRDAVIGKANENSPSIAISQDVVRASQDALAANGIDYVVLYRGLPVGEVSDPFRTDPAVISITRRGPGTMPSGVSSWTTSRAVAMQYANKDRALIKAVVPREQILSWDAIGLRRSTEDDLPGTEVLVAATSSMVDDFLGRDDRTIDLLTVGRPNEPEFAVVTDGDVALGGQEFAAVRPALSISASENKTVMTRTAIRDTLIGRPAAPEEVSAVRQSVIETRRALAANNANPVVLYRGVSESDASNPFAFTDNGSREPVLTSWTTDRRVADRAEALTVKAVVPAANIVAWDQTGITGGRNDAVRPGDEVLVSNDLTLVENFIDETSPGAQNLRTATPSVEAVRQGRSLVVSDLVDAVRTGRLPAFDGDTEFKRSVQAAARKGGMLSIADSDKVWETAVSHSAFPALADVTLTSSEPDPFAVDLLRQVHAEYRLEAGDSLVDVSRVTTIDDGDPFLPLRGSDAEGQSSAVTSWWLADTDDAGPRDRVNARRLADGANALSVESVGADRVIGRVGKGRAKGQVLVANDPVIVDRLTAGQYPIVKNGGTRIDLLSVPVGWHDTYGVIADRRVGGPRGTRVGAQQSLHYAVDSDGGRVMVSVTVTTPAMRDRQFGAVEGPVLDGQAMWVSYDANGVRTKDEGLRRTLEANPGEDADAFRERAKDWATASAARPPLPSPSDRALDFLSVPVASDTAGRSELMNAVQVKNRNGYGLDAPTEDEYRQQYGAMWKASYPGPQRVRDYFSVFAGRRDDISDGRPFVADEALAAAQLYEDARNSETVAEYPLTRVARIATDGDLSALTAGDTIDMARGFSGADSNMLFGPEDAWSYRIEPGDANVVSIDPEGWNNVGRMEVGGNEKEALVAGTFEVLNVNYADRTVTIRQTQRLPENPFVQDLLRSSDRRVSSDLPTVLSGPSSEEGKSLEGLSYSDLNARISRMSTEQLQALMSGGYLPSSANSAIRRELAARGGQTRQINAMAVPMDVDMDGWKAMKERLATFLDIGPVFADESVVADLQTKVNDSPVAVRMSMLGFESMAEDDPNPRIRNFHDPDNPNGVESGNDPRSETYAEARDGYDAAVGLRDLNTVHGYSLYSSVVEDSAGRQFRVDASDARHYGSIELVLDDSVKDRSYFTVSDSLNSKAIPIPVRGEIVPEHARTNVVRPYEYVEVQIPGPIDLSAISEIRINDVGADEFTPEAWQRLVDAGLDPQTVIIDDALGGPITVADLLG